MKLICRLSCALSAVAVVGLVWMLPVDSESIARAADDKKDRVEKKNAGPPPLVIDFSSPLLLDQTDQKTTERGQNVDNSACYVCHANYRKEELVGWHAEKEIGCVDCHGDSFAHRNDENNTTPPEVMYPPSKISKACSLCHGGHDVPAGKVVARFLERCPDKEEVQTVVCTDCHGNHRLKLRTVVWNKETGELLTGRQQESGNKEPPKGKRK